MTAIASAGLAGLAFGLGLWMSGLTDPARVIGFLDLFGRWDPTLILVLGGAVGVTSLAFPFVVKRERALLGGKLHLPTRNDIDRPLVIGAVLFGAGWGIAGYCPGPGFTSLGTLDASPWLFVGAMIVGTLLHQMQDAARVRTTSRAA